MRLPCCCCCCCYAMPTGPLQNQMVGSPGRTRRKSIGFRVQKVRDLMNGVFFVLFFSSLFPPSHTSHCVTVVVGESRTKTWCKADDKCRALNAHLVNIGSAEENKWIAEQSTTNVWIGVNKDSFLSNDWGWSDGNNHGYTNWNPGEPNTNFNNCAELMPTTGKWNDNNCGCGVLTSTLKEHFVCERAAPVTVTATTVTATTKSTTTTATMPTSTTSTTTATPTTTLKPHR